MKISFIITTFNLPVGLLVECVNSILRLSLRPTEREVIVIDDGSDMSPLEDLLETSEGILYLRQPNGGLSAARNMGLRVASGDYIQFVDGDDMIIAAPYEHCLDLVRFHNPDMVLFKLSDSANQKTSFSYDGPVDGAQYMRDNNLYGSACGYIFRRSILGDLRFTPKTLHEDEEFTPLLVLRAQRIFSGDCAAYYYRQRKESIIHKKSGSHHLRRLMDMERVIGRLVDVAGKLPVDGKAALERRIAQLTMDYLYNTIKLTHSRRHLEETMERLRDRGLYPLPDKNYTRKYQLFRKAIDTKLGRDTMLMLIR